MLFEKNKKHKKTKGDAFRLRQKIIEILNYTPVDYEFLPTTITEEDIKKYLKDFGPGDIDDLCGPMLNVWIDSKIKEDIDYGDVQFEKNAFVIREITDAARSEQRKAVYLQSVLQEDKTELEKQLHDLEELQKAL